MWSVARRALLGSLVVSGLLFVLPCRGETTPPAAGMLVFERDIRPLLRTHCLDCHGATEEFQGGLDLRQARTMLRGGESGPAALPGKPQESLLLQRIRSGEMPPGKLKPTPDEVARLERWIAEGAHTARPEPETLPPGLGVTEEERNFWSFRPIRRPSLPTLTDAAVAATARNPIDTFLLAAAAGRTLRPEADRRTLVVRAYLDLWGLPPAPQELQHWLTASGADWFERLVDHLLEGPAYGERWARHWLDVAGYADSDGYTANDTERPWNWKYRDWVVTAFNNDLPYDQFLLEQLAGDELAGPLSGDLTPRQIEMLTATGFLRQAADGTGSGADTPEGRNQVLADTLKIVGTAVLGLSVQCAQCHDHRYDPIPQTDYFALRAVFEPALDWQSWKTPEARRISLYTTADRTRAAEVEAAAQKIVAERSEKERGFLREALEKELAKFEDPLRSQLRQAYEAPGNQRTPEQNKLLDQHPSVRITPGVLYQYLPKAADELKKYDQRIAETRAQRPREEFLPVLLEPAGHTPQTRLFHRGDHQQPRQVIPPGPLSVTIPEGAARPFPVDDPELPTTGRRRALAQWLAADDNPLVARVIVNRVWWHHFGRGLVATPADFGRLGAAPTHPELLDWLADEFRRQGWSFKRLHRLILTSAAWRQTKHSAVHPSGDAAYPVPLRRLEAELVRDRMLAATGQLESRMFGPPLPLEEDETGQVSVKGTQTRRSLYIQMRRSRPVAMLQTFDAPVMETNCEVRPSSTVATQSLMLLNGQFALDQAARLAERLEREVGLVEVAAGTSSPSSTSVASAQLARAWELSLSRQPTLTELAQSLEFVQSHLTLQTTQATTIPAGQTAWRQALTHLCQALFSSNEFLYGE